MKTSYLLSKATAIGLAVFMAFSANAADLPEPKKNADANERGVATDAARKRSLGEYAFSVGIAEGRKERWLDLRKKLALAKGELDMVYQVSHLYLDKGDMQPPIILKGESLYQNHKNGKATDESEVRYEKLADARFVSSHLDWYTYLVTDEDLAGGRPPEDPFFSPRNQEEEKVMGAMYQSGFLEGANQVDMEALARTKNLTSMVCGMYNYHILNKKRIINEPVISKVYVPVSGNKTKLSLSNNLREVVADAEFNLNPGDYRALLDQQNPWARLPKAQYVP